MQDWTGTVINTAPSVEPVTVTELKNFLRLDGDAQDTMLTGFITASRMAAETETGRTFITTVFETYFDSFPDVMELPRSPVQSVSAITYVDPDGDTQTLDAEKYQLDAAGIIARIIPAYGEAWPVTRNQLNAVKVTFSAGYGDEAADVPEPLREAIKMLAGKLYDPLDESIKVNAKQALAQDKTLKFLFAGYKIAGLA